MTITFPLLGHLIPLGFISSTAPSKENLCEALCPHLNKHTEVMLVQHIHHQRCNELWVANAKREGRSSGLVYDDLFWVVAARTRFQCGVGREAITAQHGKCWLPGQVNAGVGAVVPARTRCLWQVFRVPTRTTTARDGEAGTGRFSGHMCTHDCWQSVLVWGWHCVQRTVECTCSYCVARGPSLSAAGKGFLRTIGSWSWSLENLH